MEPSRGYPWAGCALAWEKPSVEASEAWPEGGAVHIARLNVAFAAWRARPIDLSERNRASTLTIADEKPAEIYRLVVAEADAPEPRPDRSNHDGASRPV